MIFGVCRRTLAGTPGCGFPSHVSARHCRAANLKRNEGGIAMVRRAVVVGIVIIPALLFAQTPQTINGWSMQDAAKVTATAPEVSSAKFHPQSWYAATVPGTVLTTLVNNKVYPEPLYGENMRAIPESLNKTTYWYRTVV